MATAKKHTATGFAMTHGLSLINGFLSNIEGEFEKIVKTTKKSMLGLITNIVPDDFKRAAVTKINATLTDWKKQAKLTKNQVCSLLQIPSQHELASLTRKVSALEKRLNALKGQGARH